MLKSELATSLASLIDQTLSRFAAAAQRRLPAAVGGKMTNDAGDASDKMQRNGRVIDRGLRNGDLAALGLSPFLRGAYNGAYFPYGAYATPAQRNSPSHYSASEDDAADATDATDAEREQDEALSLVVSPKKRKPTVKPTPLTKEEAASAASRLSPLEISLVNSSAVSPPPSRTPTPPQAPRFIASAQLPTPVASAASAPPPQLLHHPSLFSNYSAYFAAAAAAAAAASQRSKSPGVGGVDMDAISPASTSLLHPALLAGNSIHSNLHISNLTNRMNYHIEYENNLKFN